jgi:hypothetical protein
MRPAPPRAGADARAERDALRGGVAARIDLARMRQRGDGRRAKHRAEIEFLLRQVEELNRRMRALGADEGVVDTAGIRARMVPPAAGEEEEVDEQTFHTRIGSRNTFRTG